MKKDKFKPFTRSRAIFEGKERDYIYIDRERENRMSEPTWDLSILTTVGAIASAVLMFFSVKEMQNQIKLQKNGILNTKILDFIKALKQTPYKIDPFRYNMGLFESELYEKNLYTRNKFSQTCMGYFKRISNHANNLLYDIPKKHPSREFIGKTADYSNRFYDIIYKMIYLNEDALGKITFTYDYITIFDILPPVNDVYAKDVINLWCGMAYHLVFSHRIPIPKEYEPIGTATVGNCLTLSQQKIDEVQQIADFWRKADMKNKLNKTYMILFNKLSVDERAQINFKIRIPTIVAHLTAQNKIEITPEELVDIFISL